MLSLCGKYYNKKKPDDFVVATRTSNSVKDFVNIAAKKLGIKIFWKNSGLKEVGINVKNKKIIIRINKKYFRETEVDNLKDLLLSQFFLGASDFLMFF